MKLFPRDQRCENGKKRQKKKKRGKGEENVEKKRRQNNVHIMLTFVIHVTSMVVGQCPKQYI